MPPKKKNDGNNTAKASASAAAKRAQARAAALDPEVLDDAPAEELVARRLLHQLLLAIDHVVILVGRVLVDLGTVDKKVGDDAGE